MKDFAYHEGKKVAVSCETQEEFNTILEFLQQNGVDPKMNEMDFNRYKTIGLQFGGWIHISQSNGQHIISAKEFISKHLIDKEFILPGKWCVRRTNENAGIINDWLNSLKDQNDAMYSDTSDFVHSENIGGVQDWRRVYTRPIEDYKEITFEQFEKYVLKKEKTMNIKENLEIFKISGTKLPVIPHDTLFSTTFNTSSSTHFNKTAGLYSDLISYGHTIKSEKVCIVAEKENYKGQNFYLFPLSELEKIINKKEMQKEKKNYGFIIPHDIPSYDFKKGEILVKSTTNSNLYCKKIQSGYCLPKEIVEQWEPNSIVDFPIINGKKGELEGDYVIYGNNCAKFHKEWLHNLFSAMSARGFISQTRHVKSVTLSSDVVITLKQLEEILDAVECRQDKLEGLE